MALALSAEQKDLLSIFTVQQQYVIPSYQRAYSWEYDECMQLYTDIMDAFSEKQDYFIGNLVIAKSNEDNEKLEVIDGQQRLTTLALFFKVLYLFAPKLAKLHECFTKKDIFTAEELPRIDSKVFEVPDNEEFGVVLGYDKDYFEEKLTTFKDKHGKFNLKAFSNRFERNALFFYSWINSYQQSNNDLNEFIKFLLQRTYLLPIELSGNTFDEARTKALKIFETLNNRGKNLEDADIFKGKLYEKASKNSDIESFIEQWKDLRDRCEALKIKVDDIFRYYSHVIRGKEGKTSLEINIRDFFTKEPYSPFQTKNYKEVLDDLVRIVEAMEYIHKEKNKPTVLAKWLQLVEIYTNQYPKMALVVYLFVNNFEEEKTIEFLKKLIRFTYYAGSTSTIKFQIFNIIREISIGREIDNYTKDDVKDDYFSNMGLLKKGYALLAFYLTYEKALTPYSIDNIVNSKDKKYLSEWSNEQLKTALDSLGNTVILDLPKKDLTIDKKAIYYQGSAIEDIQELSHKMQDFTFENFQERDKALKRRIIQFFKGEL
jgi:uncharacterized protein with ParB-like and HNH nuclease domain